MINIVSHILHIFGDLAFGRDWYPYLTLCSLDAPPRWMTNLLEIHAVSPFLGYMVYTTKLANRLILGGPKVELPLPNTLLPRFVRVARLPSIVSFPMAMDLRRVGRRCSCVPPQDLVVRHSQCLPLPIGYHLLVNIVGPFIVIDDFDEEHVLWSL